MPDVLDTIADRYVAERERGENFQSWTTRLGKVEIKKMLKPFQDMPLYEERSAPVSYTHLTLPTIYSV